MTRIGDKRSGGGSFGVALAGLASLAGGVLIAGCATVGHPFSPLRVPQIENGRTTKADLRIMFGEPYRRGIDNGDSTWTYVHYKFRLFGNHLQSRDLYFTFDGDRVKSYTYNSDMD